MFFTSLTSLFSFIVSLLFRSRRDIILQLLAVQKQNEILTRKFEGRNLKIRFSRFDRILLSILNALSKKVRSVISIVQPETVLRWYRNLIRKRWTFPDEKERPGRPSVSAYVRLLILTMKNENLFMRTGKIQGELLKLGIELSQSTIRRILQTFRKQGKLKRTLTWKKFIQSNIDSLFSMDFFTVDSLFGKRFYVFFIMFIKTRKIVQCGITDVPDKHFVRNQLVSFREDVGMEKPIIIHDRAREFCCQDFESLGIRNVPTSPESPNMNAHAERFVGSIRREVLDSFIIFGYNQLYSLVKEYVDYYNRLRPHQGIEQEIPDGYTPQTEGTVVSKPILSGLWHHYYRTAA